MKTKLALLCLACGLVASRSAFAAPVVKFQIVINPCVVTCPSVADFFALRRGDVVPLRVYAVDGVGGVDTGYAGTVTFTSTDPLATLPPPYTFTAADQGIHLFLASTAFQTLGLQILHADDAANGITGSASVTIIDFTPSVPAMTPPGMIAAVALLAVAGIWLIRGARG